MDQPLAGKRALVGGGSRGIGRACAVEFARLGAEVTVIARNESTLAQVVASLPTDGTGDPRRHRYLAADFTDPDAVRDTVEGAVAGDGPFEIFLNNTGGPPGGPAADAAPEAYAAAFSQHLVCGQIILRALLPGMKTAGYGRIVNIISTSVKQPIPGLGVSNTVRGAVANWSKTVARELAPHGITVNNILPGATLTNRLRSLIETKATAKGISPDAAAAEMIALIPAGRFGQPEEIAAAAGFLAGPEAGYITGINLPVDGGRTGCL